MSSCCGNHNGSEKNVGEIIAKSLICTKANQSLVMCLGNKILAVLFWLSVVGSFVIAYKAADAFSGLIGGFQIGTFICVLIGSLVYVFVIFYFIYLLKAINDKLGDKKDSCCETNVCEQPNSPKPFVSKAADDPVVKVRKKTGPKKGSKRVKNVVS
jgi:large-conductance mechanosensitive channel